MDVTPRISTALLRTQTDARLAELIAAGHERAFEAVVDRYERPLRRYCQRMLSDGLAEDVVQQAFLTAWSQLRNGQQIRELRPWLYRVAHNAALNTIKRAGYQYEQLDDTVPAADAPDAALERSDSMRSTINALKELPDRQREALVRTAIDGESRTVVALDLGLSDGAVGQLLHRARCTLRSAATAITPFPLLTWLAGRHGLASPHLVGIGGGKAAGAGTTAGGTSGTVAAGGGIVASASSGAGIGIAGIATKAAAVLAVGAVVGVAPVMAPRAFSSGSPTLATALADDSSVAGIYSDAASMRLAAAPAPASIAQEPSAGVAAPSGSGSGSPETPAPTTTDGTVTDATTDPTATDATASDGSTTDTSTDAGTPTDTTPTDSTPTHTTPADTTPTDTTPTDTTPTDSTPTDTTPTDTTASASTSASPPVDTSSSAAPPDPGVPATTP